MLYNVQVKGFNPNIEEEILIQIGNEELLCFVTGWIPEGEVLIGKNYNAAVDVTVLDGLDMREQNTSMFTFQQIDNSFAYFIYGTFDFDAHVIDAGGVKLEFDADEISDYAYLDGKSVVVRIDRITVNFIN
jgi:hypothetical protein